MVYIGYPAAALGRLPATVLVDRIATVSARTIWTNFFRDSFIVGAIAFAFPILILVGTATRLAGARREERYAALRLVGATNRQISVISSVDAVVSALLGSVLGIVIFLLLRRPLADTAITSARYFYDQVTPTAAGYLVVLIGVPAASAISSLISLRRVRVSPLGVSRRVTPPAPSLWRVAPLLAGIILFAVGLALTSHKAIGKPTYPGLLIILVGLVVAGPWLTAQAARLLRAVGSGASALLAARRLGDNPRGAFRSVSGLVLAVFLGTVLGGLLPAVQGINATPAARKLSNVLLDGFTASPVCGISVNCTSPGPGFLPTGPTSRRQRIAAEGLPPQDAAAMLAGLRGIRGTTVVPVYSVLEKLKGPGQGPSGSGGVVVGPAGPGAGGLFVASVMSCASLRELAVLGQCAPGRSAAVVQAPSLFSDNPHYSTQPIASASSPAASDDFSHLYLQAVLVKVHGAATLERVRTYLVTHGTQSASGWAPRTFGEEVQARAGVAGTVERLIYIAVALTLIVAGCSLAVSVGGSLVERKRPFTLLRVSGTPTSTLYRVVFLEAVLPLVAATVVAGGIAYGVAALTVARLAPVGTPAPAPGHAYYLTMGIGLVASLLVILASLPLLGRITGPASVRFE